VPLDGITACLLVTNSSVESEHQRLLVKTHGGIVIRNWKHDRNLHADTHPQAAHAQTAN
jgi:hypothetical protein